MLDQPFLLPSETEELVSQLRESGFFEIFRFGASGVECARGGRKVGGGCMGVEWLACLVVCVGRNWIVGIRRRKGRDGWVLVERCAGG